MNSAVGMGSRNVGGRRKVPDHDPDMMIVDRASATAPTNPSQTCCCQRCCETGCPRGIWRISSRLSGTFQPMLVNTCHAAGAGQRRAISTACGAKGRDTQARWRSAASGHSDGDRPSRPAGIAKVLTTIFDPSFSDSSFGFRPGRNAHQAIRQTWSSL